MSRICAERILVAGTLECLTPLHVGGLGADADVDMSLAINGRGNYYVPGTSIAGALRAWVARRGGLAVARQLFGYQTGGRNADGHASYLRVDDSELTDVYPEVREGVGIDRHTGAAAERILYTRAILPTGTCLPFSMALHLPGDDEVTTAAVYADLVEALQRGWIALGAGTSRGLGRVELKDVSLRRETLSSRKGMLAALRGGGETIGVDELRSECWSPQPQPMVSFLVRLASDGAMMIRSGTTGVAVDDLPLTTTVDDQELLVLSGSSVKGALRSAAERIVRTVARADSGASSSVAFSEELEVPLVREVFGSLGDGADDEDLLGEPDEGPVRLGLGALSIPDVHATPGLLASDWRKIVGAESAVALRQSAVSAGATHINAAFHVSVDRWTGEAAGGRLFSNVEPLDVEWEPMRIDLDLRRLGWESADSPGSSHAGIALVVLALHELSAGRVPLGFAATRGMGGARVSSIELSHRDLAPAGLASLEGLYFGGGFEEVPEVFRELVGQAWTTWCEGQLREGDSDA